MESTSAGSGQATPTETFSPAANNPGQVVGSAFGVTYVFGLPQWWTTSADEKFGDSSVTIFDGAGRRMAGLAVYPLFDHECNHRPCESIPFLDVDEVFVNDPTGGEKPAVVRSIVGDMTGRPALIEQFHWQNNVRLAMGLRAGTGASPPEGDPTAMAGMLGVNSLPGNLETLRIVSFTAVRDFPNLAAAEAFTGSDEYALVQKMIASFKVHACTGYLGEPANAPGQGSVPALQRCPASSLSKQ